VVGILGATRGDDVVEILGDNVCQRLFLEGLERLDHLRRLDLLQLSPGYIDSS
jgi:hypothetical protein